MKRNVYEKQQDGGIVFQKSGFIDIHSHILPCLDDGPVNLDQSLEAIKQYEALGFSSIIATPHWIPATSWAASPAVIVEKVNEINSTLKQKNIAMTILPGMEIAVSDQLLDIVTSSRCLTLGRKGFFLIEFPLSPMVRNFSDQFFSELTADQNLKFIIAHPERCPVFLDNPNLLQKLVSCGMLVQLNITSILGGYGRKIQETSLKYLTSGLVHFLATDSHARSNRMPPNKNQWRMLQKIIGTEGIKAAFAMNPGKMLAGNNVTPLEITINNTEQSYRVSTGTRIFNSFWKLFSRV